MIELKEISKANLEEVLSLKVAPHQACFVSSPAHSLAQAYVYRDTAFPFAIYAGQTPVGFVMLGYYEARNQYTLWKFLIDKNHQNKGYGREALLKALAYLKDTLGAREVYTGVSVGNEIAKRLYASVGFMETGLVEDHMEEMRFVFR